jgi:hypothetical protein
MTSERTKAYGRVVKTLEDVGPAKLLPTEQERIREAADVLIFAAGADDARAAIEEVEALPSTWSAVGAGPPSAPRSSSTT